MPKETILLYTDRKCGEERKAGWDRDCCGRNLGLGLVNSIRFDSIQFSRLGFFSFDGRVVSWCGILYHCSRRLLGVDHRAFITLAQIQRLARSILAVCLSAYCMRGRQRPSFGLLDFGCAESLPCKKRCAFDTRAFFWRLLSTKCGDFDTLDLGVARLRMKKSKADKPETNPTVQKGISFMCKILGQAACISVQI